MTDWQILHLLQEHEEEQGEQQSYDELFHWVWSKRGYTDAEIERIWQWRVTDNLSDDETWKKMQEAGFARE